MYTSQLDIVNSEWIHVLAEKIAREEQISEPTLNISLNY